MRKKFILFMFITIFAAYLSIDYKPQVIEDKPNAYEVIKYMGNDLNSYPNDINDFYLLFDTFKLDSSNFESTLSYFDLYDYELKEIYPYINPMYQNMLSNIVVIPYNGKSLKNGIANIYSIYMEELEKYRLSDEIDKALVNGIKIRMIKIKVNNEVLSNFLRRYRGVKYSLSPYGLFVTF